MFRNMVTSFLAHEKITTTDAKAKELRSIAEKMVTLGKRGDLHAMRQAASYIRDKKVVTKLFTTIAPRYKDRAGGYTRIIKLGIRPGDNAPVSIIELVEEQLEKKTPSKSTPKKAAAAPVEAKPVVIPAVALEAAAVEAAAQTDTTVAEITDTPQTVVKSGDEECEAKAD
jgi:large subunit ribosomal protein L17